jgi:acetyl esterase/lipase
VSELSANGVQAALFDLAKSEPGIILYLHGGAYAVVRSPATASSRQLAKACQMKVLAIDYRLAPENPFPAALQDALAAYQWLFPRDTTHPIL